MKSKLSHPAVIIIISVVLSQIASMTINTVVAGIDEVRSPFVGLLEEGSLADFEPFAKTVSFFFKPYTQEEVGENELASFFTDDKSRLSDIEARLQELDGSLSTSQIMEQGKPVRESKASLGRIDELENKVADLDHELKNVRELQKAEIRALRDIDHKCFMTP